MSFPADCVLHARRIGNREALTRVRRRIVDADNAYAEQVASAHGPLSYVVEENRALARELDAYLQWPERPPLLHVAMSLAVGAAVAGGARAARGGAAPALRHRRAAPAARAAARAVPRSPAAGGRRPGPRLRRRAHGRAVRRADAGRHAPGRVGAWRGDRPHQLRRAAAGEVRHHRSQSGGPAAVDAARRHARVREDDRRAAARLPRRTARQPRRRRRPQARSQPRSGSRSSRGGCR